MPRPLPLHTVTCLIGIILLGSLSMPAQGPAAAPERGGIDWIFVIDTSASMRGAGGTEDIFDAVKRAVSEFIVASRQGDSVTIYTFDRDTEIRPTVRVTDETDKRDLMNAVDRMRANGDRTYTGKALRDALIRARELGQRADAGTRKVAIVLLTDGLEDVRGIADPVSIPDSVELVPEGQPFMFFVSLGEQKETAVEDAFKNNPKLTFRTIDRPSRDALAQLADTIRPVVEAAATPKQEPLRVTLGVSPATVDFGVIEPGGESEERTIEVTSTHGARLKVALEGPGEMTLLAPTESVAVAANQPAQVEVRVGVAEAAQDGARWTRRLTLQAMDLPQDAIVTAAALDASIHVVRQPLWRKALWFVTPLLIAFVVGAYWIRRSRQQRYLEGEIEIIQPRPAAGDDTHVSLASLQAGRAHITALVPALVAGDSDGELFTEFRRGIKHMRFRRTRGTARVNGAEVAVADLYDGHLIEVGDARIRFHWLGHEEPAELEDG